MAVHIWKRTARLSLPSGLQILSPPETACPGAAEEAVSNIANSHSGASPDCTSNLRLGMPRLCPETLHRNQIRKRLHVRCHTRKSSGPIPPPRDDRTLPGFWIPCRPIGAVTNFRLLCIGSNALLETLPLATIPANGKARPRVSSVLFRRRRSEKSLYVREDSG